MCHVELGEIVAVGMLVFVTCFAYGLLLVGVAGWSYFQGRDSVQ